MSRKYRQSGYQDDDRPEPRGRSSKPQGGKEGPRGRGLGRPTSTIFRCRDCGAKQTDVSVATDAACRQCGAALHSCVNCAYFDPSARNECRQEPSERIVSKTKANDCDLYAAKTVTEIGDDKAAPSDPRAAFDALFK